MCGLAEMGEGIVSRLKKIYLILRVAAPCLAPVCAHLYLECTLTLLLSIYIPSHYSQNPPELMSADPLSDRERVSTCCEGVRPPSEISQSSQHGPDGDVSSVSSHQRHLLLISESQI